MPRTSVLTACSAFCLLAACGHEESANGQATPSSTEGTHESAAQSTEGTHAGPPRTATPRAEPTEPAAIAHGGAGAPIALHLDWPAGARGRVESARSVERTGLPPSGRAVARYRVAVRRHGAETSIETSELSLRLPDDAGPAETLHGVLVAMTFVPSTRFTRDMDALSLIDPERSGDAIRSAVARAARPEVTMLPGWQSVGPVVSGAPEMLTQQASSFLGPIVILDGLTIEPNQIVTLRDERQTSAGEPANQSTMTSLLGTGPCFEGDDDHRCVSLEVTAHYDAQTLGGAPSIRSIDGTMRMVLEASTLLPHRIEAEKRTVFLAPDMMGEPTEQTETETLSWLFRWDRASIRD
jgi:hypothetical protein